MSESEIVEANTNDLLDIAARKQCARYQIAVWPGPTQVLASNASVVETTEAVVFWQTLTAVRVSNNSLIVDTTSNVFSVPMGRHTFVIRPAVTS